MDTYVKFNIHRTPICQLQHTQFKLIKIGGKISHHCFVDLEELLQKYEIIPQRGNSWPEVRMFFRNKAGKIREYSIGHINPEDKKLYLHGSLIIMGPNWYEDCRWCSWEPEKICKLSRYRYHMLHHIK